jgi:hypothetical protein
MQGDIEVVKEIAMRAWSRIYEGDSIIHCGASLALPKVPHTEPAPAEPSLWIAASRAVAGFFSWLERGAERARYRQLENYLADSGDVFELERRMRKVELRYGATIDPYS